MQQMQAAGLAPAPAAAAPPQQDDFVRAVLLTFDPTTGASLKQAAEQYCDNVRASPDGWRLCLQKLHEVALARGSDQVKFWCLSTLLHAVETRYASGMTDDERTLMRRSLMLYVRDVIPLYPQPGFLQNKLCAVFVHIVKHDYPASAQSASRWPSFFTDFLSLLERGPQVIDVFVRLLKILDEEVVEVASGAHSGRNQSSSASAADHVASPSHATLIKDSMRAQNDLAAIVDAVYSICQLYHQSHPALVADALEAFSEYIKWIDIGLVATERFLTLFYALMNPAAAARSGLAGAAAASAAAASAASSAPSTPTGAAIIMPALQSLPVESSAAESARLNLQIFATDNVIEIIEKRMPGEKKIRLLQQLRILDFLTNALLPSQQHALLPHQSSLPAVVAAAAEQYAEKPAGVDSCLQDKYTQTIASLIQSIGSECIESMEKLVKIAEKAVKAAGGASAGAASPPEAAQAMALVSEAMPLLEQALSLSYRFFEHPLFLVSQETVELYAQYVALLKRPGSWPWSASMSDHLRRIFEGLSKAMAFPPWFDAQRMDDEDELFLEFRQRELLKLFTNVTLANPPLILELLGARLKDTLQQWNTLPYSTVEVTLKLLYQLVQPLHANKHTADEPYRSMIGSLLSSPLSGHPHPSISLLYFELVVMYVQFLDTNPEFIGPVLASFLDARGIRNASAQVRGRACYRFYQCVSALPEASKKHLRPFLDSMLQEIQKVIETVLGPNAPNAPGMGSGGSATRGTAVRALNLKVNSSALVSFAEVGYLCESMGILVSSVVSGQDQCHHYVSLAFHFFRTQLESAVSPQGQALWYPHDAERVSERLAQLIESVSTITKPLHHDAARIHDLMLDMAHLILKVLTLLPTSLPVVLKSVFFAHRMIDCQPHNTAAQTAALSAQAAQTGVTVPAIETPLIQFFGLLLPLLLKHAQPNSIVKIIDLLNLAIQKLKKPFEAVLDSIFLLTVEKVFEALASYAHIDQPQQATANGNSSPASSSPATSTLSSVPLPAAAYSAERQERQALQQRYYAFLASIVSSDLVSVLASPTNARHIKAVLDTILAGCVSPPDFLIHRACFQLLRQLVTLWSTQGALAADPALQLWVMRDVTTQLFKSVCSAHFDLGDPNYISAVRDLLELQKSICKALGDAYVSYLSVELLPSLLHVTPDVAQQYCRAMLVYNATPHIQGSEWKQFEAFFRAIKASSHNVR